MRQASPRRDLAESPAAPLYVASPPVPWPTQGRQASPRPFSVARRALVQVVGHVAMPAPATYALQSPRRLAPQEVYETRSSRLRFQKVAPPQVVSAPGTLVPGMELQVGYMRLRCEELLGSGSYSTVWLAQVVSQRQSGKENPQVSSVALKDVFCRGEAALQQSLFEVQLLMAVERRMSRGLALPARLPRCLTYQVDSSEEGWCVRMALTRLKGQQLDGWLQNRCDVGEKQALEPWALQLKSSCILARQLLLQLAPTLESLAPLAWHRDVNSHNVLLCNEAAEDGTLNAGEEEKASFWLCDLGLAVDSQSWVGEESLWRTTDIGGDCRYWPASCWMVHCFGADYLEERPKLCQQYKTRLDIHALGITAIEIICTVALALRSAGAPQGEASASWSHLLDTWKEYHETVSDWWQAIYSVFSAGGDFRPVHAWLAEISAPDKVLSLVSSMRIALLACAAESDQDTARLLQAVAEATYEESSLELAEICDMAKPLSLARPGEDVAVPPSSTAAADMAAGAQEIVVPADDVQEKPVQREASTPAATGPCRSTKLLKSKLEEEHLRLSSELEKLQKHRSRVVMAKSILQQLR